MPGLSWEGREWKLLLTILCSTKFCPGIASPWRAIDLGAGPGRLRSGPGSAGRMIRGNDGLYRATAEADGNPGFSDIYVLIPK